MLLEMDLSQVKITFILLMALLAWHTVFVPSKKIKNKK